MARDAKEDRLIKAKQARAKAEQDVRRVIAEIRESDRRLDTRRKIIIGGAMLELAKRHNTYAVAVNGIVRRLDRQSDKDAFADWDYFEEQSKSDKPDDPEPS